MDSVDLNFQLFGFLLDQLTTKLLLFILARRREENCYQAKSQHFQKASEKLSG